MSSLPRVVVEDVGLDAVLMDDPSGAGRLLVLRPEQSFASAVAAVSAQLPHLREDQVRALVRQHLPEAPDVHAMLAEGLPEAPAPPTAPRTSRRRLGAVLAVTLVLGGAVMGAGIAMAVRAPSGLAGMEGRSIFAEPDFTYYAARTGLVCEPLAELTARCTTSDGRVGLAEAAVTARGSMFMFIAGDEQLMVRAFPSALAARSWMRQPGSAELPHVVVVGRYVVWGTEAVTVTSVQRALAPTPQGRV